MSEGLRVFWHSAPPWVSTGYGILSKHITTRLRAHPEVMSALAWLPLGGQMHAKHERDGIELYPVIRPGELGEDSVPRWSRHFKADIVVSITDQWVWTRDVWKDLYWIPMAFPDHEPISSKMVNNLKMARHVVVPTEWGLGALENAKVPHCRYIPLGIETGRFTANLSERAQQRASIIGAARRQGAPYLTEDCFIFGMVARNGTYPCRKGHDLVMDAVGQLLKRGHKDFIVYMHTMVDTSHGGVDLIAMVNAYGRLYQDARLARHVLFPPCEQMHLGGHPDGYDDDRMRFLYNAMDCLVNPSQWEGFCLPVVEAAACGVPSIVTDAGCQPETGAVGWKVPVYKHFYGPLSDAFVSEADLNGLVRTMETAMREARRLELKEKARRHAEKYDWDDIVEGHWVPFLLDVKASLGARRKGLVAVGA